jgi:hypothetical protein
LISTFEVIEYGKYILYSLEYGTTMKKTIFMVVIAAVIATMASAGAYSVAYAQPNEKSGFGQATRENLAQDGEMGDHSKAGGAVGDPPFDSDGPEGDDDKPGRSGIGNVRDAFDLDHVSEIPDTLCSLPGQEDNSACSSDD